jgi:predicted nucleic acid-binding Zn ribbon protein
MNYFERIILIKYVCGHKKYGIDIYQAFVTKNAVKCPKCNGIGRKL